MRVTVDLDRINTRKILGKIALACVLSKWVECKTSSGGKGIHLILWNVHVENKEDSYLLRYWFGDDIRRIRKDVSRGKIGLCEQVLFTKKEKICLKQK
jgi:hypothetical protein